MIAKVNRTRLALIVLLLIAIAGFGWNAFAGSKRTRQTATNSSSSDSADSSMQLSGEELWSNNCQRCHNIRPPTMYSNAQWDVIVHQMRVRANITGSEQRAIVEFLKSSSH
jgi:nitrate/TMAO reductase-like tetraheme cytochrome c subunit